MGSIDTDPIRLLVDGHTITARPGDSVLVAIARADRLPAGSLCASGDCPNCLAIVDGVSHVRMCQTLAREALTVSPFPVHRPPPLPTEPRDLTVGTRFERPDVVVVGGGRSGMAEAQRLRDAGSEVIVLEARDGDEALAVYTGPEVVARYQGDIVRFQPGEVVIATGSSQLFPVAPGNDLAGILTPAAWAVFESAGVDLGSIIVVGEGVPGLDVDPVLGEIVVFEGRHRLESVVVRHEGEDRVYPADTVVVNVGRYPRDVLFRMVDDASVRVIGSAGSDDPTVPTCPDRGIICPCSEVTVADLDFVWSRGFQELELIKRATLAGTGTCQGAVCTPYLRAFVRDRGGELQPTFTARPLARQLTIGEAAAGFHPPPIRRTRLDGSHRSLGARMDRIGGWWRPWVYPDPAAEYDAVRNAVSIGDVGTLGKMRVWGPDVVAFLERVYPCRVSDLRPGRSRYALLLGESGAVFDDGLISRLDEETFDLTFTSGGAGHAEAWLRDWAHGFGASVRMLDRTHSLGAINVTGPAATELVGRLGLDDALSFMHHRAAIIAGVDSHVYRLSFTGEVSYEIHHPHSRSTELWNSLLAAGADLGIAPHGLSTLQTLRLEKGHILVGVDTEMDSTPRRLGMEWAVRATGDFVGRQALARTSAEIPDRLLSGWTTGHGTPEDGSPFRTADGELIGYVTSAAYSPALDTSVMLGWIQLHDGEPPDEVMVDGQTAHRAPTPFYDPTGSRARA